jgi:hypothetical protein
MGRASDAQKAERLIVQRWPALTGKKATLASDSRTFDEIAQERRKESA